MRPVTTPHRRPAAFTLIELLVVIAIIAILAALIMVSVGKVKEKSITTKCGARLRSISQAIQAYAADNQTLLPSSGLGTDSSGRPPPSVAAARWPIKLSPYMGGIKFGDPGFQAAPLYDSGLYKCPLYDNVTGAAGVYGLNEFLADEFAPVRQISIQKLAQFPMMGEAAPPGGLVMRVSNGPHPDARKYGWSGSTANGGPAPNHNGSSHFLFADGHVELRAICDPNKWPWNDPNVFKP